MDIAWLRDLVIVIDGLIATVLLILIGVMLLIVFRSLKGIMVSLDLAAKNIEEISTSARREIATPLAQASAVIQGFAKVMQSIGGIFQRKKAND